MWSGYCQLFGQFSMSMDDEEHAQSWLLLAYNILYSAERNAVTLYSVSYLTAQAGGVRLYLAIRVYYLSIPI